MSLLSHRIVISAPLARSVAIAALLGATFLANPLTAARADGVAAHPVQIAQAVAHPVAAKVTSTKAETVEHRITESSRGAENHARRRCEMERRRAGDA